ncbi:MAG TPA: PIG-L deacetylase family protein [Vicinamibacterales bacterium]|jgi:LmbE family N-acetylglucosaminyl deacetylase|nr:PIG-L deacetylase family protein [Vicinamibacterales bacterium]
MHDLAFLHASPRAPLRVLCVGAHCDDIEIGCGGALLCLQAAKRAITIDWAVLTGERPRQAETRRGMAALVRRSSRGVLRFGDLRDGRLPAQYDEAKAFAEGLKDLQPDVIFCHERGDRHQDHRVVNELVWNTFRDHVVLEYEIPKWDGGLGQPNVYVPVTAAQARRKVATLLRVYGTQTHRDWFSTETFMAMLRLRGLECRSPSGLAEGFHGRKLRLTLG